MNQQSATPPRPKPKSMTRKQRRLAVILALGLVLAIALGLVLVALRDQLVFFYSPSEIAEKSIAAGIPIRLGGLVQTGSWIRTGNSNQFVVSDGKATLTAHYTGILPDLFREGQGVVLEGAIATDGSFSATTVLAKHDEKYMPREVVEALKKSGEWQRQGGPQ